MFKWGKKHKTIRQLRRKRGFTANELAMMAKVDTIEVLRLDDLKLKDIDKEIKDKLLPYL
ncbi:MAG: transcriptional regulator [Syntrophomonadaceae bacterium]|jgi:hypothetical protein|nr:transcriptional regulator [Syntrophomonadaceae bacterium]